jgi:hypothetical protein
MIKANKLTIPPIIQPITGMRDNAKKITIKMAEAIVDCIPWKRMNFLLLDTENHMIRPVTHPRR